MCYTFNPIDLSKDLFQFEPFFAVSIARFCTVVLFLVATLNWRHQMLFKFHTDRKVESFWTTSIVRYFLYTVTTRRYLILITEIRCLSNITLFLFPPSVTLLGFKNLFWNIYFQKYWIKLSADWKNSKNNIHFTLWDDPLSLSRNRYLENFVLKVVTSVSSARPHTFLLTIAIFLGKGTNILSSEQVFSKTVRRTTSAALIQYNFIMGIFSCFC